LTVYVPECSKITDKIGLTNKFTDAEEATPCASWMTFGRPREFDDLICYAKFSADNFRVFVLRESEKLPVPIILSQYYPL
jgi:hypothetical protein